MGTTDDLPCGALEFGDDGRVADANATLLRDLGYSRDELVGAPVDSILPAAARIFMLTHLRPMLQLHGRVDEAYFAFRRRDGAELPVLANAVRLEHAPGTKPVNVVATIPIRRRGEFEQRLVAARRSAEDALRARSELLALKDAQNAELERIAARLRELAAQTDSRRVAASRATARSLHEGIAQEIAALRMGLDEVRRAAGAGPLQQSVERLEGIAAQSLAQVRSLSYELHPPVLDHAELPAALRAALREFEAVHGIRTQFRSSAHVPRVDAERKLVAYRFLEEALANAARHGAPACISVELEADAEGVALAVSDDGSGAHVPDVERAGGLGLLAASERLRTLGGALRIESAPGHGFRVTARFPVG